MMSRSSWFQHLRSGPPGEGLGWVVTEDKLTVKNNSILMSKAGVSFAVCKKMVLNASYV